MKYGQNKGAGDSSGEEVELVGEGRSVVFVCRKIDLTLERAGDSARFPLDLTGNCTGDSKRKPIVLDLEEPQVEFLLQQDFEAFRLLTSFAGQTSQKDQTSTKYRGQHPKSAQNTLYSPFPTPRQLRRLFYFVIRMCCLHRWSLGDTSSPFFLHPCPYPNCLTGSCCSRLLPPTRIQRDPEGFVILPMTLLYLLYF
jgi:hypothetical protein